MGRGALLGPEESGLGSREIWTVSSRSLPHLREWVWWVAGAGSSPNFWCWVSGGCVVSLLGVWGFQVVVMMGSVVLPVF